MLFKGLIWIAKEIQEACASSREEELLALRQDLVRMYSLLESGQMTEEEFDMQEQRIVAQLDQLEQGG